MTMRRLVFLAASLAAVTLVTGAAAPASAFDRDQRFFQGVEGEWTGPGEIVAGKYKGTKFVCNFTGATPDGKVGMSLDGGCRVGLFTQHMTASVERARRGGYHGTFLDGAGGQGLDVVAGRVSANRVVFSLNRKKLNGAMLARLADQDTMNITISVRVEDQMVPVIGVSLKRVDSHQVGSLAQE